MPKGKQRMFRRPSANAGGSDKLAQNLLDRRVECRQLERLDENCRIRPLEEKLNRRVVPVAGKKNEAPGSPWPHPRDRPIKHLAPHPRHHHVANDDIERVLRDLAQAFDTARDRRYLETAEGQVIAENLPEIMAIFQEQNPPGRPSRNLRGNVALERNDLGGNVNLQRDDLCGIAIEGWRFSRHSLSR